MRPTLAADLEIDRDDCGMSLNKANLMGGLTKVSVTARFTRR